MLQELDRIPVLLVIILVIREFYITSLRLLARERGFAVPVSQLGKWKTGMQMVGIPNLMAFARPWGIPMPEIGTVLIYGASIISLYSALEYTLNLFNKIKAARIEKRQKKEEEKIGDQKEETPTEENNSEQN